MTYRSFTPLATRKAPSFRGKSIYLDGISDYIDLQGETSPCFWRDSRTRDKDNEYFRTASWSFWVKFPQTTLDQVQTDWDAGLDMKTFILSEGSSDSTDADDAFNHCFAGLAYNGSSVKFAVGWGRYALGGGGGPSSRAIRMTSTAIAADTWYHVAWTHGVGRSSNQNIPAGLGWDTGLNVWVNGTQHNYGLGNLIAFYMDGSTTEMGADSCLNAGYNDNTSTAKQAAYIGRKGSNYTEMTIHECAFWEGLALDHDAVTTLYGGGVPLADLLNNSSNYDIGRVSGPTKTFTFNTSGGSDGTNIIITDWNGKAVTYQIVKNGTTGDIITGVPPYTDVTIGYDGSTDPNAQDALAAGFAAAVNHENGHGWNTSGGVPAIPIVFTDGGDLNLSPDSNSAFTNFTAYSSYTFDKAFDALLTSGQAFVAGYMSSGGYIEFDLGEGATERIFKITLQTSWNNFNTTGFTWQSSVDGGAGGTWVTHETFSGLLVSQNQSPPVDVNFSNANPTSRYWRMMDIQSEDTSPTIGLRITELRVHKANYTAAIPATVMGGIPSIYATSDGPEVTLELAKGGSHGLGQSGLDEANSTMTTISNLVMVGNAADFDGGELLLSPDLSSADGWSVYNGGATQVGSGTHTFGTGNGAYQYLASTTAPMIQGEEYQIQLTVDSISTGAKFQLNQNGKLTISVIEDGNGSGLGVQGIYHFIATHEDLLPNIPMTDLKIYMSPYDGTSNVAVISNVTLKKTSNGGTGWQGTGLAVKSGLMGWWRFRGSGVDGSVHGLNVTPSRIKFGVGHAEGTDIPVNEAGQARYDGQPLIAQSSYNNGGTYVNDSPS